MGWRIAKSLLKLREQINLAYPKRDKSSDGGIGDEKHATRKSDHNPWVRDGAMGIVTAFDFDENLAFGVNSLEPIITAIRLSRDKRVKYIIYEKRITVAGTELQQWKEYKGTSSHSHHAHISVFPEKKLYDDETPWVIEAARTASVLVPMRNLYLAKPPMRGTDVKLVQLRLAGLGFYSVKDEIDGIFGVKTHEAVWAFQLSVGLETDGIVGENTKSKLFEGEN